MESEKEKRYFAFDTVELTRGDFTSRMNGYAVALDKNVMQLDEVREREDLPPLGFNFIKLGLQDVLLDVKTNRIYTPNTNKFQDLGDMTPDTGIDAVPDMRAEELRYNHNHGEDGRFTNKKFSSNAVRFSNGGAKPVDKSNGSDIIDSKEIIKAELKSKIESGEFPTKVDKSKQEQHVIGNPYYEKRIANGEFPSYVTVSKMEIQKIINSKSLTGTVKKGTDGQYRELITADEYFGVCCSLITHEKIRTNRGMIHYSKNGTHLVPTYPKE